MATKPKAVQDAAAQDDSTDGTTEKPVEGCVWMWRTTGGVTERAEVDMASGSTEVMAALGWGLDQPAASAGGA